MSSSGTASVWRLGAIFLVVLILWNTFAIFPLKVLVVLLHEISHGVVAVATGGRIDHIEVNMNEGGVCYTYGGSRFLTLSAGYLGSLAFGAAILVLASRSRHDRRICAAFGAFLLLMTVLYVRNKFGFALGLLSGGAMVAALRLPDSVADTALKTIGVTSCLYAILDIKSDILRLDRATGSDADMLAQLTGVPAFVWGVVWISVSVVVTGLAIRASARGEAGPSSSAPSLVGARGLS